jgi:DNA-binding XRE family transcriptional regulator
LGTLYNVLGSNTKEISKKVICGLYFPKAIALLFSVYLTKSKVMIYFIKHTEYVKIGYTNKIKLRLSTLQVSCPVKLEVLALIEGNREDEIKYQKMFMHLSTSGEWFNYTNELLSFIEKLDEDLLWKYGFGKDSFTPIGLIKQCRLEKRWSMEELGEALGITKQGIYDMELRDAQGNITIGAIHKALSVMGYKYQNRAK